MTLWSEKKLVVPVVLLLAFLSCYSSFTQSNRTKGGRPKPPTNDGLPVESQNIIAYNRMNANGARNQIRKLITDFITHTHHSLTFLVDFSLALMGTPMSTGLPYIAE